MFCYQCEQTVKGTGCKTLETAGRTRNCGASGPSVHGIRGLSIAHGHQLGVVDRALDTLVLEVLFTTVTNVNFDPQRLAAMARQVGQRNRAKALYEEAYAKQHGEARAARRSCRLIRADTRGPGSPGPGCGHSPVGGTARSRRERHAPTHPLWPEGHGRLRRSRDDPRKRMMPSMPSSTRRSATPRATPSRWTN